MFQTIEQRENRLFQDAVAFRVHRLYGSGKQARHESCELALFPDAIRAVGAARQELPDARVLLYAVTMFGHFTLLPEARWAEFLSMVKKSSSDMSPMTA